MISYSDQDQVEGQDQVLLMTEQSMFSVVQVNVRVNARRLLLLLLRENAAWKISYPEKTSFPVCKDYKI